MAPVTERRQHRRYPTAWVYYESKASEKRGPFPVVNASENGLYLAMEDRPAVGSTLIIDLVVEGRTLLLIGDVVRHLRARPGAPMPGRVGLKLTTKPENWAEIVKALKDDDSALGKWWLSAGIAVVAAGVAIFFLTR